LADSLPSAPHYERAALYLATHYADAAPRVFENLTEDAFLAPRYRALFQAALRVYQSDEPLNIGSLIARVQSEQVDLKGASVTTLLIDEDHVESVQDLDQMVARLSELAALRKLADLGTHLVTQVYEQKQQKPRDLIAQLEDRAFEVERQLYGTNRSSDNRLFHGEEYVLRRQQGIAQRLASEKIQTGLSTLDKRLTVGLAAGQLSIIAGRPGVGKSSVKINFMRALCEAGQSVLSFTPEMGIVRDGDRLDSLLTRIPLNEIGRIRSWDQTDARHQLLEESIRAQSQWPLFVYPDRAVSVAVISAQLRRLRRLGIKVDVVFVDLFDRLRDVAVTQGKNYKVGLVLQQMSELASTFQCHFCNLVQIRRLGRQTNAKRYKPTLEDLKDSGSFEEMADLVLLLFREGYYNKDVPDNRIEICLAKQRDGMGGDSLWFEFHLNKELMEITPLEEREDDPAADAREASPSFVDDESTVW